MGTAVAVDVASLLGCGSETRVENTSSDQLAVAQCSVSGNSQAEKQRDSFVLAPSWSNVGSPWFWVLQV